MDHRHWQKKRKEDSQQASVDLSSVARFVIETSHPSFLDLGRPQD